MDDDNKLNLLSDKSWRYPNALVFIKEMQMYCKFLQIHLRNSLRRKNLKTCVHFLPARLLLFFGQIDSKRSFFRF